MSEAREILIGKVFPALRRRGFLARANFWCCGGCGAYNGHELVEERGLVALVFWHAQDEERLRGRRSDGKDGVHLRYGASEKATISDVEVGEAIAFEARLAGLRVEWSGKSDRCVWVELV